MAELIFNCPQDYSTLNFRVCRQIFEIILSTWWNDGTIVHGQWSSDHACQPVIHHSRSPGFRLSSRAAECVSNGMLQLAESASCHTRDCLVGLPGPPSYNSGVCLFSAPAFYASYDRRNRNGWVTSPDWRSTWSSIQRAWWSLLHGQCWGGVLV